MLTNTIKKFGFDANSRQLKRMKPIVDSINDYYNKLVEEFGTLNNEQFRDIAHKKTAELKKEVQEKLKEATNRHESMKNDYDDNQAYKKAVEEEKKEIFESILPEAFALVKEASRRTLKAKDGQPMVHFDVQLMGGIALHEGKMVEMKTGEGKTLVLTLPAYLNALTGEGVHVVTVNEYLAQRDAKWMGPIYDLLGVSVGINLSENGYCTYDPNLIPSSKSKESLKKEINRIEILFKEKIADIQKNNKPAGKERRTITVSKEEAEMLSGYEKLIKETASKLNSLENQIRETALEKKKNAYKSDITYGVNHEFGFDYLRDNTTKSMEDKVQRGFNYAIVDEVDNILIDEARTPHILSAPTSGDVSVYNRLRPDVISLIKKQREVIKLKSVTAATLLDVIDGGMKNAEGAEHLNKVTHYIEQADPKKNIIPASVTSILGSYLLDQTLTKKQKNKAMEELSGLLFQIREGDPRNLLLSPEILKKNPVMLELIKQGEQDYNSMKRESNQGDIILGGLLYVIKEKDKNVYLTEQGMNEISEHAEMFTLPDLIEELSKIDSMDLPVKEKQERKNSVEEEYAGKSESTHAIQKLLYAYCMFNKDVDYVVKNGEVVIIDESTGREMPGRRWSEGLHEAVEAKEEVEIQKPNVTLATISLQNYFRMYNKLAGTSGTVYTEAQEFMNTYKIDTVVIPTNKPMIRKDYDDVVYKTEEEKWDAVVSEIKGMYSLGRPVLVGTASIEKSELLSRLLQKESISHKVLNATRASEDGEYEARVIAEAGQERAVTISTNMAGRGTDIILGEGIAEKGGLHVIGTEKHESRRIDNQLRGRAGRQGDQGSSKFIISLEDDIMRMHGGDRIKKVMTMMGFEKGEAVTHSIVTRAVEKAQERIENHYASVRKELLKYDEVNNAQRVAIYADRDKLMNLGDPEKLVNEIAHDMLEKIIAKYLEKGVAMEEQTFKDINSSLEHLFGIAIKLGEDVKVEDIKQDDFKQNLYSLIDRAQQEIPKHIIDNKIFLSLADMNFRYKSVDEQIKQSGIPDDEKAKQLEKLANEYKTERATFNKKVEENYNNELESIKNGMGQVYKELLLGIVDKKWRDHLLLLEDIKEGIYLRAYGQKDPLVEYKKESSKLFDQMMEQTEEEIVQTVFKTN